MSVTLRIDNGIAHVSLAENGMNTLSKEVLASIGGIVDWLYIRHKTAPLTGVLLTGNERGFGAGANIHELHNAGEQFLSVLIDTGHEILQRIEESPFPWIAVLPPGPCLGGMCEVVLACRARIAHAKAKIGLPEVNLNVIPGLGGTQRLPRLVGLERAIDLIVKGRVLSAAEAKAVGMIDVVAPSHTHPMQFAEHFLRNELEDIVRPEHDFSSADKVHTATLPIIHKMTGSREYPRAPFVALGVITKGVQLKFAEGLFVEKNLFIELATSREGRAGMRTFITRQQVENLDHVLRKKVPANPIEWVGVAGIDGYMGNAIAFLALRAGFQVRGWVHDAALIDAAKIRLAAKYRALIKIGKCDEATMNHEMESLVIMDQLTAITGCNLIIEALAEDRKIKERFFRDLGGVVHPDAIVASNSSSMGPGFLEQFFHEGGGENKQLMGLHFFSPAEHPSRALVEIIAGSHTSDVALVQAHGFVRRIGKTPIMIADGSIGFLVNAGLAAYFIAADQLYREGTPIETIDRVMRERIFPMGPFELADAAGIDTAAGMLDFMQRGDEKVPRLLIQALRDRGRLGQKNGGGFYHWAEGKRMAVWEDLPALCEYTRGERVANDEEIEQRCIDALTACVEELVSSGIVSSREEADLAFVLALGFAQHLGGPLFYQETREQVKASVSNAMA